MGKRLTGWVRKEAGGPLVQSIDIKMKVLRVYGSGEEGSGREAEDKSNKQERVNEMDHISHFIHISHCTGEQAH